MLFFYCYLHLLSAERFRLSPSLVSEVVLPLTYRKNLLLLGAYILVACLIHIVVQQYAF